MESPFDILRIESDADAETIERAYRERVIETHPDQGGSISEFQLVRAAYEAIISGVPLDGDDGDSGPATVDQTRRESSRIEYLNYAVLDDHGWALDDDDLFEKASNAGLDPADYGRFLVKPHESLLEAAENRGFAWPFACRGGACANCAVAVVDGELSLPVNHILPDDLLDRGFRLSCNGMPKTREMQVVYNVKHLPGLDELRLPPYPFEMTHSETG